MSDLSQIVSINDLNNGAVDEIVKDVLPKILDNIADENTSWSVQRGIDIKVRMKITDESRETMITMVEVVPKLANPKPHESTAHLLFNGKHTEAFAVAKSRQPELGENVREFPGQEAQ